jgi:hypothetical protein
MIPRIKLAVLAGAMLLYGCASSPKTGSDESPQPTTPLAGMLGRQVLVLPTQYVSIANPGGGWDIDPSASNLTPILDEEIADTFHKRGVKSNWTFGKEITQAAYRNGGLVGDPRELGAQTIRRLKAGDTPLPEPLGTQIRNLVALTSARYAVLPLEVHIDTRNGERRGSMRVLLIDSRTARIAWVDDVDATPVRDPQVVTEVMSPYGFRILARDLATHFADMVVAQ